MITGRKTTVPGSNFQEIRVNDVAMTLSSITITHAPTKTQYYISDDFEKAGMEVTATFTIEGGATFTKVVEDYSYSPRSFDTAGIIDVTVSYTYKGVSKTAIQQVTVTNATSYQISDELQNGSLSGDTQIIEGQTANITVIPLEGAILPQTKEVIDITGATMDSYNSSTGAIVLSNPTSGVVVTARCPDEDTWMDTVAINNKTYRQIFATASAKILKFDGMVDYVYNDNIMQVYSSSGPNTGLNLGTANADTLGRSLKIHITNTTRSAWKINQSWTSAPNAINDVIFHAAKIKGGVTGSRPAESSTYTKLGVNQRNAWPFGTLSLVDTSDPAQSDFSDWTTRSAIWTATNVLATDSNAYWGFPGTSGHGEGTWYVDDVFVLNLTKIFGAGNEPTLEQMTSLYESFITLWKSHNELQ